MAILAGIDEAGYGPVLGPLVVTGVAFRVPDDRLDRCLWQALRDTCTRTVRKAARKLVVADSKKLYKPKQTIMPLERAALVMLAVAGKKPRTFQALLEAVAPEAVDALAKYPWYRETDLTLPLSEELGDVATRANAIKRNANQGDITFLGVFAEPLPEGHYNRLVKNTRNKAVVSLGLALRIIDRIMKAAPNESLRICLDRQGGRTHYREPITTAMPGYDLQVLEETTTRSAYRLERSPRTCSIEFLTEGEDQHFPVALASVYSKYLRELYMHQFNRYWCGQRADLKPTAGYYTDAQRWLRDAAPTIRSLQVPESLLVRQR